MKKVSIAVVIGAVATCGACVLWVFIRDTPESGAQAMTEALQEAAVSSDAAVAQHESDQAIDTRVESNRSDVQLEPSVRAVDDGSTQSVAPELRLNEGHLLDSPSTNLQRLLESCFSGSELERAAASPTLLGRLMETLSRVRSDLSEATRERSRVASSLARQIVALNQWQAFAQPVQSGKSVSVSVSWYDNRSYHVFLPCNHFPELLRRVNRIDLAVSTANHELGSKIARWRAGELR